MSGWEPTVGEYGRRIWTPADPVVKTADGVPITHGMRVFTNNLDRGVIDLLDEVRPATYEWHGPENRWVLWFEVRCFENYKGEASTSSVLQSHDRVARRFNGKEA